MTCCTMNQTETLFQIVSQVLLHDNYMAISRYASGPVAQSCPWVQFVQPNPPNDQPNPTHTRVKIWTQDPTQPTNQPIPWQKKTTTNLLVQKRQLSNRSREEIRDAPNYKFTKQFDANICQICLLTPWPSVSTTLVASMNSAHIKIFNPTHQKSKNLDPTQFNPTQPMG